MSDPEIKIDESKHVPALTVGQKLKNSVLAIIYGALLIQVIFFFRAFRTGSFMPTSIVIYWNNPFFLGYLLICGVLGWVSGKKFVDWLNAEMSYWKFW